MSVHFTGPVWKLALPTSAKIVLLKFGDNANDDGYAWPSLARVAKETSLGLSTVRDKAARFRRHGVLILKKGGKGGRAAADYEDDSPGATSRYFIDLERAKDLYREGGPGWDYEPKEDEANPPGAGGLEDIHNPPDDAPNPPDETPNPPAPGIPPTPPYKDEPSSEPSSEPARARDAAAVDNSGAARAPEPEGKPTAQPGPEPDPRVEPEDKPEVPPPVCAVWREHAAALRALPEWELLRQAIPDSDDGETLTLAVKAPWLGYAILAWASGGALGAEAILGRRIACRVRRWVETALAERGEFVAGRPSYAAHRRDGESVSLGDTAWQAWQTARREHPDCAWLDQALPDDIEDGTLIVGVGEARILAAFRDGAAQAVAAAVGLPVAARYRDVEAGLRAQRRYDPLRSAGGARASARQGGGAGERQKIG